MRRPGCAPSPVSSPAANAIAAAAPRRDRPTQAAARERDAVAAEPRRRVERRVGGEGSACARLGHRSPGAGGVGGSRAAAAGDVAASSTRRADRARFAVALLRRPAAGAARRRRRDLLGLLARCYRGAKGDDYYRRTSSSAAALLKEPDGASGAAARARRCGRGAGRGDRRRADGRRGRGRLSLPALLGGKTPVLSDGKLAASGPSRSGRPS